MTASGVLLVEACVYASVAVVASLVMLGSWKKFVAVMVEDSHGRVKGRHVFTITVAAFALSPVGLLVFLAWKAWRVAEKKFFEEGGGGV